MSSIKPSGKKARLAKASKQTRYAPFWVVPRIFGLGRAKHVHPYRVTAVKRSWRRERIKA
jgi:ribosomal protein L39E